MKKLVFVLLLCCAVVSFAALCDSFSAVIGSITLDTPEGVLGDFDIEVKIPKSPSGIRANSSDPAIIEAVKKEIARRGGTRAIGVQIDGREVSGTTTVRVRGTVVNTDYSSGGEDSLGD
jgi:hypothetical protein